MQQGRILLHVFYIQDHTSSPLGNLFLQIPHGAQAGTICCSKNTSKGFFCPQAFFRTMTNKFETKGNTKINLDKLQGGESGPFGVHHSFAALKYVTKQSSTLLWYSWKIKMCSKCLSSEK